MQSLVSTWLGIDPTELGNLVDLLYARSLGHPHYLIQAIDALVASGALVRRSGAPF